SLDYCSHYMIRAASLCFFFFSSRRRHTRSVSAFLLNRSSDLLSSIMVICMLNVRSSLMAVNIHITIIELNALHTKRQNLFQELEIGRASCRERVKIRDVDEAC